MKKILLVTCIFCSLNFIYSTDYSKIDKQSLTVPSHLKTVEEISTFLTRNLTSQTDKTRAIYFWISNNIRYDMPALKLNKTYENTQQIIDEVLKNRKGVCQHYAELFNACCKSAGVQSYIIHGYTDQKGEMGNYGHAWNAVKITGNYYGVDATWAAGHLENGSYKFVFDDKYFLVSPDELIKSHHPYDPIWQFSSNPITHKEIESSDFTKLKKTKGNFDFNDSINAQSKLSQLEIAIGENRRISKFGITNQLIRTEIAHNQQLITTLKFNFGVALFNKAVANYNTYVLFKNKQFQNTKLTEDELTDFISLAKSQIDSSKNSIRFLNSNNPSLNKSISETELSLQKLKIDVERELAFMEKYKKTKKLFRYFLFFK